MVRGVGAPAGRRAAARRNSLRDARSFRFRKKAALLRRRDPLTLARSLVTRVALPQVTSLQRRVRATFNDPHGACHILLKAELKLKYRYHREAHGRGTVDRARGRRAHGGDVVNHDGRAPPRYCGEPRRLNRCSRYKSLDTRNLKIDRKWVSREAEAQVLYLVFKVPADGHSRRIPAVPRPRILLEPLLA